MKVPKEVHDLHKEYIKIEIERYDHLIRTLEGKDRRFVAMVQEWKEKAFKSLSK